MPPRQVRGQPLHPIYALIRLSARGRRKLFSGTGGPGRAKARRGPDCSSPGAMPTLAPFDGGSPVREPPPSRHKRPHSDAGRPTNPRSRRHSFGPGRIVVHEAARRLAAQPPRTPSPSATRRAIAAVSVSMRGTSHPPSDRRWMPHSPPSSRLARATMTAAARPGRARRSAPIR
jgi:hypothetical protein